MMNTCSRRDPALGALIAIAALLLLFFLPVTATAGDDWYPERRRDQFPTDPGHVAIPLPFNLEGIGWGVGVLGALTNVAGTTTDISGAAFTGDITGGYLAVDQLHLVPRRLVLDVGLGYMSQASVVTYNQRGMDSDRDDYSIVEFGDMLQGGLRLTATFLDRRFEGFVGVYGGSGQLASIRDRDGDVIVEAQDAPTETVSTWIAGARLDFTDDAMDPRRGLRAEASVWRSPPSDGGPDFVPDGLQRHRLPAAREAQHLGLHLLPLRRPRAGPGRDRPRGRRRRSGTRLRLDRRPRRARPVPAVRGHRRGRKPLRIGNRPRRVEPAALLRGGAGSPEPTPGSSAPSCAGTSRTRRPRSTS